MAAITILQQSALKGTIGLGHIGVPLLANSKYRVLPVLKGTTQQTESTSEQMCGKNHFLPDHNGHRGRLDPTGLGQQPPATGARPPETLEMINI